MWMDVAREEGLEGCVQSTSNVMVSSVPAAQLMEGEVAMPSDEEARMTEGVQPWLETSHSQMSMWWELR